MAVNPNKVTGSRRKGRTSKQEDDEVKQKIQEEFLQFLMDSAQQTQSTAAISVSIPPEHKQVKQASIKKEEKQLQIKKEQQQQQQPAPNVSKQKYSKMEDIPDFFKQGDLLINQYMINKKIKAGGFGQIYIAKDVNTQLLVAVKVEKNVHNDENTEGTVLQMIQGNRNFPKLFTMGVTPVYMLVVMQLLGENLSEIRRSCPLNPPRFTVSSSYRTIIQMLKATAVLHDLGFLHRDIKPSNFAVGRKDESDRSLIYMLDFGLCRQYLTKNGSVKKPRETVGFRGTVRYAAVAAHEKKDLCRRDDLWSLFYSFVEILTGQLPWRKTNDKFLVLQLKLKYSPEILCKWFPPEIAEFCRQVKCLQFADRPDYESLILCFTRILPKINVNVNDQYDWQLLDCRCLEHWKPPK